MLSFHPEHKGCCRLSFIGSVHADTNFFSKMEVDLEKISTGQRTLIVDITKLTDISNASQEVLPHLFKQIKSRGFYKVNLLARRGQSSLVCIFEEVLDREFGPDGTISLE